MLEITMSRVAYNKEIISCLSSRLVRVGNATFNYSPDLLTTRSFSRSTNSRTCNGSFMLLTKSWKYSSKALFNLFNSSFSNTFGCSFSFFEYLFMYHYLFFLFLRIRLARAALTFLARLFLGA